MKNLSVLLLLSLMLSACGSEEASLPKRPRVSYATPVVSSGMNYGQYKSYMDSKASRDGGAEAIQRQQEMRNGNHALQKRFMALDRNNNGSLSADEFNGY